MPIKPIKHGIKVFAICMCAYTEVVLGFEVYCGSDSVAGDKSSALATVVERLLNNNHLNNAPRQMVLQ